MSLSPQKRVEGRWHRVFKGTMLEIPCAAVWIESIAADLELTDSRAFAMQVCLEELMSNIVRHGRVPSPLKPQIDPAKPLSISITVDASADRITITVEDNGQPFNVAEAPAKWIDRPLEQLQPGGLGIRLIKNFASNLEYRRTAKGNRVIVEFRD
jgi:anti-sigma regulatory factor (Ser/Thr protein kinase)